MTGVCKIAECEGRQASRGWCNKHYYRWRKFGDVNHIPPKAGTPLERFERRKIIDPQTGCWTLPGEGNSSGYAQIAVGTRYVLAHRWAYEQFVGPIPAGLEIDHLCRNKPCVNPSHMEPVTHAENMRRAAVANGWRWFAESCPSGHLFDEANTYRTATGSRACRTCRRQCEQRRRDAKRVAA